MRFLTWNLEFVSNILWIIVYLRIVLVDHLLNLKIKKEYRVLKKQEIQDIFIQTNYRKILISKWYGWWRFEGFEYDGSEYDGSEKGLASMI